ncbi:MAG TPA: 2'-5' RNA ligase family protein [Dehalococcoidia bacterium]|nr:2'-5' RNA ligase family protein [Dehalococcoidia bacterium]
MASETLGPAKVNRMTSAPSPQGRRILVAVVTGEAGERIQTWRLKNDPKEAERLPPHATLCYWAPQVEAEAFERQVRHAFPEPVSVKLGEVKIGDNDQGTYYVEVKDFAPLDAALARLYDGTFVEMPKRDVWRWHVSCVRDSRGRDRAAIWQAARELVLNQEWRVDKVAYLELRGTRYQELATWRL